MRLNKLGDKLFDGIDKESIDKWFMNFSDTEQYPAVLPSLGFYNIVNGTQGLAISISANIPQFNLKETNEAMIKLLWNPNIDFNEIYCEPDFISGATILNASQVKESLRKGSGEACKIRSTIKHDEKKRILNISEIPYGIFTETICKEIIKLTENEPDCGIDRVNDFTGATPNIVIYLKKDCDVEKLLNLLYKKTSLQSSYGINMIMLDKGTTPKCFGWREALQAHLEHEKEVRTKIHIYEIKMIDARIDIINGLLTAIDNIDETVNIIKNSDSKKEATDKLIKEFFLNQKQAEAILQMTLSRLINLEVQTLKEEKDKLLKQKSYHNAVLKDNILLYKEIEEDLRFVAEEYGDSRRTTCIDYDFSAEFKSLEQKKEIPETTINIDFSNLGNFYAYEDGKNRTTKLQDDEVIIKTLKSTNKKPLYGFSSTGQMYIINSKELPLGQKIAAAQLFGLSIGEKILNALTFVEETNFKYIGFVTKTGMFKKTELSEYKKARRSTSAIKLKDDDSVVSVLFLNEELVNFTTLNSNVLVLDSSEIKATGKATKGVIGIKLGKRDEVVAANIVKDKEMIAITNFGTPFIIPVEIGSRATKGINVLKNANERIINTLTFSSKGDIILLSNEEKIRVKASEIVSKQKILQAENKILVDFLHET